MDITLNFNNYEMEDIDLIQTVFPEGNAGDRDHYLWKYLHNPHGQSIIAKAVIDNSVIARVAFTPVLLCPPGTSQPFLAAQTVDTAIDLKYRNFFILLECYEKALSKAKEMGINCIYGFPNIDAYPVTVNGLGFRDLFSFYPMIYFPANSKCSSSPSKTVLMKAMSLKGEFMSLFGKNGNETCFRIKNDWSFSPQLTSYESWVIKDASYVEWRYRKCPGRNYLAYSIYGPGETLQGKVIIRKRNFANADILVVSDILLCNSENEAKLQIPYWLITIARERKLPIVYYANHKEIAQNFSQKGYMSISSEISRRNHTVVGLDIHLSLEEFFDNISFSLGDMDMG